LRLFLAASCLSRIYKIYSKVKEKYSEAIYYSLEEVNHQDKLLNILDTYESILVQDLQVNYILDNID
jgi:hypothetical protein